MSEQLLVSLPLEKLGFSEHLNGEFGTNRASDFVTKQISANNDLQAIESWIAEFEKSPQTLRAYRREAERLLLWTLIEKQKPLSSLTRDDLCDYQHFLADPQPNDRWCGSRKRIRFLFYLLYLLGSRVSEGDHSKLGGQLLKNVV